jgi:hypothetical protein
MEITAERQLDASAGFEAPSWITDHTYEDYRILPITEGFDWQGIIETLADRRQLDEKLYLVVFRSIRQPEVDPAHVTALDTAAHEEAERSDALLHYFPGELDEDRRAMSWCLWTDMDSAREALSGPAHQDAVRQARDLYEAFAVELYDVYLPGNEDIVFDPLRHGR